MLRKQYSDQNWLRTQEVSQERDSKMPPHFVWDGDGEIQSVLYCSQYLIIQNKSEGNWRLGLYFTPHSLMYNAHVTLYTASTLIKDVCIYRQAFMRQTSTNMQMTQCITFCFFDFNNKTKNNMIIVQPKQDIVWKHFSHNPQRCVLVVLWRV